MDDLYREHILDHYSNPRNHGTIEDADATAEGMNPLCGDELTVGLRIDAGRITDIKFHGRGCAISQASASILSAVAAGEVTPDEAGRVMALLTAHKALVETGDLESRITALEAKT